MSREGKGEGDGERDRESGERERESGEGKGENLVYCKHDESSSKSSIRGIQKNVLASTITL